MGKLTLKGARVNAGFTQEEVAEKLKIAPATLRNWEKASTFPKPQQIMELCSLYGCSYDDIKFF